MDGSTSLRSALTRKEADGVQFQPAPPEGAPSAPSTPAKTGASVRRLRLPPPDQDDGASTSRSAPLPRSSSSKHPHPLSRSGSRGKNAAAGDRQQPLHASKSAKKLQVQLQGAGSGAQRGDGEVRSGPAVVLGLGSAPGLEWMARLDPGLLVEAERRVARDGELSSSGDEGEAERRFDDAVHAPRNGLEEEEEEEAAPEEEAVHVPRVLDRPLPLRQPFSRVRKIFPGESLPPLLGGGARIKDEDVIKMWHQRGVEQMRRAKWSTAALAFSKGLWQDPWCRPLRIERLKCYFCLSAYEQAQTDAELLIREDRNYLPGLLFLAEAFFAQGKYEFARLHAATGLRLDPASAAFRTFAEQVDQIHRFRTEGDKSVPQVSYAVSRGLLVRRLLDPVAMAYEGGPRRRPAVPAPKLFPVEYVPPSPSRTRSSSSSAAAAHRRPAAGAAGAGASPRPEPPHGAPPQRGASAHGARRSSGSHSRELD
eukprot:tig00021326_g20309.t1